MKNIKLSDIILGTPPKRKRKTIPQSVRTRLYMRSKGKCERCHEQFEKGIKPHIHNKDGDPKNNKLSNLEILCPNCHSKTETYKKPKTKSSPTDIWGIKSSFF
jgi:5-methylcytosine-specific restriction endonuclease McrA